MMPCEETQPMLRALPGSKLGFRGGRVRSKRCHATQLVPPVRNVGGAMVEPRDSAEAERPLADPCRSCRNAVILTVFTAAMVIGWSLGLFVGPF